MKKINYIVKCNNSKVDKKQNEDINKLLQEMIKIIYKRRELECYEKTRN